MERTIEISMAGLSGFQSLLCTYSGQQAPQDAYIEMDEEGFVSADYTRGNTVPFCVWHERTLRFSINPELTREQLIEILSDDEVLNLLEIIHQGHSVEWDGKNQVGRFTDEAEKAQEDLTYLLDTIEPDSYAIGEHQNEEEEGK